ncbi:MAG: CDP-archaeol synthase [Deltaproteobacteria bacterium]
MQSLLYPLLFLLWCNFLPPLATLTFGRHFDIAIDGGLRLLDGEPLFGPHKTVRGILAALLGSLIFIPFLATYSWFDIPLAALFVCLGDLTSSFIKRRLHRASGHESPLLDQIFEGLLPVLYLTVRSSLTIPQALLVLLLFIPLAFFGSSVWHYLLAHPADQSRLGIVRSKARMRAWRACHQPLARWQVLLNFESFFYYRVLLHNLFKASGIYRKGYANAGRISLVEQAIVLPRLPRALDGFRILLLTDLHLDGQPGLAETIVNLVSPLQVDICLIGGDIRMGTYGPLAPALRELKKVIPHFHAELGIFGVLGNHDCLEMIPDLEDLGIVMLVNDSVFLQKGNDGLYLAGLDDSHYYKTHDPAMAYADIPLDAFSIVLSHSPEAFRDVASFGPDLFLCGHTHGGQIRLPGRGPIFTHSRAPRFTAAGLWQYGKMVGYTSCGVGSSGIPLRFNCTPEISLLTLKKSLPQP